MGDLQEQLAVLRQRIARVDEKYAEKYAHKHASRGSGSSGNRRALEDDEAPAASPSDARSLAQGFSYVEEMLSGEEVQTAFGRHFETEKLFEGHRRHGSADIGALADLPANLLDSISEGGVPEVPPEEWAFLDTETTGLAGGTGTCAFLVGVGRITREGFRVRQFFMRDYAEEPSLLDALSRHLAPFRVLITYNGRSFDQPLLETRYRLNRARPPFTRLEHLDLLYGARRLWKLRFESCRLVDLENQVLGVERQGDLAGALIPYVYFEYLRTREAARMLPIFHHNATDILTLACLTGIVPLAFQNPGTAEFRHGAEGLGIARWLRQAGELEQALDLFRRAVEAGLPDALLFQTLWDAGAIERKLGRVEQALATWTDLAAAANPFRVRALEEMAKHYEHREKNYTIALEMTRSAIEREDSPDLRKRERRLLTRVNRPPKNSRKTVTRASRLASP